MAGSSRRSPRRPGRRHFTDQAQGLLTANLTLHGIDAGETLESIAPIGLRRFRSRRGAGKHLTAQGQGLFAVTVGQQAVIADPHEAVGKDMQKKTAEEFLPRQCHLPEAVGGGGILPSRTTPIAALQAAPLVPAWAPRAMPRAEESRPLGPS